MKASLNDPKSAASASFLLALPITSLFLSLIFSLQPSFGALDPLLNADGSHLGTFILLGMLILQLVGLELSSQAARLGIRQGERSISTGINLLLAVAMLLVLVGFIASIVIDQ